MAEELQSLLEKIQRDGVEKAAAEREKILEDARSQAQTLIDEAKAEAEKIRSAAEKEAATVQQRAENAIRQAARDILLELKSELKKRLEAITRQRLDEALTADFMAGLIQEIAGVVFRESGSRDDTLEVMVSPGKCDELVARLTASAGADMVEKCHIFANSSAGRGLKISVENGQVFFDLSDTALTGMICEYAGNRVSAVLTSGK